MSQRIKKLIKRILFIKEEKSKPFYTKDYFRNYDYEIGDYTYGFPLVVDWRDGTTLRIGKFCSIADDVRILLGGNHRMDWVTTYPFSDIKEFYPESIDIEGHPASKGDVVIGNDVWIGRSATILSGVNIGDGAVIAANSLISKNIGPYEIWGGNPARLIKKRFDDNTIEKLISQKWWDWSIDKIRRNVHYLCSKPEIDRIYK